MLVKRPARRKRSSLNRNQVQHMKYSSQLPLNQPSQTPLHQPSQTSLIQPSVLGEHVQQQPHVQQLPLRRTTRKLKRLYQNAQQLHEEQPSVQQQSHVQQISPQQLGHHAQQQPHAQLLPLKRTTRSLKRPFHQNAQQTHEEQPSMEQQVHEQQTSNQQLGQHVQQQPHQLPLKRTTRSRKKPSHQTAQQLNEEQPSVWQQPHMQQTSHQQLALEKTYHQSVQPSQSQQQTLDTFQQPHVQSPMPQPCMQRPPMQQPCMQESLMQQLATLPYLTYRQKRRLKEALRNGPKRGKTRGLKYKELPEKPYANITDSMRRVVGENADRFICQVSIWVKEFCPIYAWSWKKMDQAAKDKLLAKIKEEWKLPTMVDGKPIDKALEFQCKQLYKGWRYRLKERYYRGYTLEQAIANRPMDVDPESWRRVVCDYWSNPKVEARSEKNRLAKLRQTITPANGALSTSRIFHDMVETPIIERAEGTEESVDFEDDQEPVYVRLYERTKRHKDGTWDPDAYEKFLELKKLHATQIEKYGVDNLSVKEAFTEVLEAKSGYVRGLGPGPKPLKTRQEQETSELTARLTAEVEALQQSQEASKEREANLSIEIEDLKASNAELKLSNEELQSSNKELREELDCIKGNVERLMQLFGAKDR